MKQLSSITSIGFIILRNQLYLPLKGAASAGKTPTI
jgi:hypothetical protein